MSVVLPASGWEMMAKVRRRAASSSPPDGQALPCCPVCSLRSRQRAGRAAADQVEPVVRGDEPGVGGGTGQRRLEVLLDARRGR